MTIPPSLHIVACGGVFSGILTELRHLCARHNSEDELEQRMRALGAYKNAWYQEYSGYHVRWGWNDWELILEVMECFFCSETFCVSADRPMSHRSFRHHHKETAYDTPWTCSPACSHSPSLNSWMPIKSEVSGPLPTNFGFTCSLTFRPIARQQSFIISSITLLNSPLSTDFGVCTWWSNDFLMEWNGIFKVFSANNRWSVSTRTSTTFWHERRTPRI